MVKKHLSSPIILAVLCAVGVHTVLFTDAGHRMQGAITESAVIDEADSKLVINGNTVSLIVGKDIVQATDIYASLVYNSDSLVVSNPTISSGKIVQKIDAYSEEIHITYDNPQDIVSGSVIASWDVKKTLPETHTINLSDVRIKSQQGEIYLSTKGTGVF